MTNQTPTRLALFIDADNLSPSDIDQVFEYFVRQKYQVPVRRAYGGYEKLSGMKEILRLRAVRAFVNQGKGTTDVALVVDAMDLLHSDSLPSAVAIVSSDADFAPLALRLREANIHVICFANRLNSTPGALMIAYDKVIFVDDLVASTAAQQRVPSVPVMTSEICPATEVVVDVKVDARRDTPTPAAANNTQSVASVPKSAASMLEPAEIKKAPSVQDDPGTVRRILAALPGWLPNTVKNLNQIGAPLRADGIAKGSKPLHELFRKHPTYFKVVPTTGPAKQVKLLKNPT